MGWGLRAQIAELEAHITVLNAHIEFQRHSVKWWQERAMALNTKMQELEQALAAERRKQQKEDA